MRPHFGVCIIMLLFYGLRPLKSNAHWTMTEQRFDTIHDLFKAHFKSLNLVDERHHQQKIDRRDRGVTPLIG